MGSITRSFANNIGSSGILTASAVTNTTVEDVTSFDNAASPATLVLLSTQTASASANISFTTGLDSTYDEYIFKFIDIHPSGTDTEFDILFSSDGGSTYGLTKTTTAFYALHNEADTVTALTYSTGTDLAQSTSPKNLMVNVGDGNDESGAGTLTLFNPSSTTYVKHFIANVNIYDEGAQTVNRYTAGYVILLQH
jgi:hypothetical protein